MAENKAIKEKYATMPDGELLSLAMNESHQLTNEALVLLKNELARRQISYDIDTANIINDAYNLNDTVDETWLSDIIEQAELGKRDSEIIAFLQDNAVEEQNIKELLIKAETIAVHRLKKGELQWLTGSVFLFSGIAITFLPLTMPANRLTYIIAWIAIIFGSLKALQGLNNRIRYKKVIKNFGRQFNY